MYLIFNTYGHCEMAAHEVPVISDGQYCLEVEWDDARPFAWSDGTSIWFSDTPPPSHLHRLRDGKWVLTDTAAAQQLAASKTDKIKSLNEEAQAFINAASGADLVPDFELSTWPLQSAEAQAWAADNTAATPILDGIAAARGMDADKLKAAALRKALAYSALSAHVAGQRQALQSQIESAKTVAALDKIKIEFAAPEAV